MRRIVLCCLLVVAAMTTYAQDFQKAIEDMHRRFQGAENIRISMSVNAFESTNSQQPFYQEKVSITRKGNAYHHHLSASDMIMNEKYVIVVDHQARQILINKRDLNGESSFHKSAAFSLDSVLRYYEGSKFVGVANGVSRYSVVQKSGDIREIEFFIEQQSARPNRINYYYRSGQFVTIAFNEFEVLPSLGSSEFDEQQFVRKDGKSWQPVASLAGYRVVGINDDEQLTK